MQSRMNLDPNSSVGALGSISALDAVLLPRYRWYHVKEAFSPNLVNHAIEDSSPTLNDLVLDPFSGSGTVPLAASIGGFRAVGFEVNPFLAFVSRTKLIQCDPSEIDRRIEEVLDGIELGAVSKLECYSTFSEQKSATKWLFNRDVLRAFEGGWEITTGFHKRVRDLVRLCLIGAAMDVANATKDGKALRYREDWREQAYDKHDFLRAFRSRIEDVKRDLELCPLSPPRPAIRQADSRKLSSALMRHERFGLCVTSPPYLNSFDYTDIYRPELFLGKFVNSDSDLRALRLRTLRSHVQVAWPSPTQSDFGQNFSECFAELKRKSEGLWDHRIPMMVQAYFEDTRRILDNLRQLARPNASVWIVVSTSAYAGIELPVDLIIADIGTQAGWYLREVSVVRHLRRVSGQQWDSLHKRKGHNPRLRESIIILDAAPRRRSGASQ